MRLKVRVELAHCNPDKHVLANFDSKPSTTLPGLAAAAAAAVFVSRSNSNYCDHIDHVCCCATTQQRRRRRGARACTGVKWLECLTVSMERHSPRRAVPKPPLTVGFCSTGVAKRLTWIGCAMRRVFGSHFPVLQTIVMQHRALQLAC
jgi:hypothetical protein